MEGRHSSSTNWPYYRSLVAWFLPWMFVAAIAVTGVWVAVDALGRDAIEPPEPQAVSNGEDPQRDGSDDGPAPDERPSPSPSATPAERPGSDDRVKPKLITRDVTVQVLNGTASPGLEQRMADRLDRLGFDVVSIESSTPYAQTTVFWSAPEFEAAATSLAERFGWAAAPKPANLSAEVSLHVVVGADES